MKIYDLPEECLPIPELDIKQPVDEYFARVKQHEELVKQHLISIGYTGPLTGMIYSTPKADGYANYMYADFGRQSCLIHLPYGDAWHDDDVQFLPKKTIVERIQQQAKRKEMFSV